MRNQTRITQSLPIQNLPRDDRRTYLAVFAEAEGPGIYVTISSGTTFHIKEGTSWGPMPAPMNDIVFSGEGSLMFTGKAI